MDWPDIEGWIDNLNLEPKALIFAVLITFWMVVSLFDDPFNMGMNTMPLFARIITVLLIGPITYIIVDKMVNK